MLDLVIIIGLSLAFAWLFANLVIFLVQYTKDIGAGLLKIMLKKRYFFLLFITSFIFLLIFSISVIYLVYFLL